MHQSEALVLSWQRGFIAFSYDSICDLICRENTKPLLNCRMVEQINFEILEIFFNFKVLGLIKI